MLNTIKIQVLLIALVLLPIASNVWADQSGRDDGHSHHGHGYRSHANPDLTLVSGMDNIDSRVLVDPAPDPAPEVIYESVPEVAAPTPSQRCV